MSGLQCLERLGRQPQEPASAQRRLRCATRFAPVRAPAAASVRSGTAVTSTSGTSTSGTSAPRVFGEVTLTCAEGDYAGQNRGIVKYFFEVGAGRENFTWAS